MELYFLQRFCYNGKKAKGDGRMIQDVLMFFDKDPNMLPLYEALEQQILSRIENVQLRVQKTQITFSDPRGYLFASRPRRRGGGLMVTFGLSAPLKSPRLFAVANPAPGRYTHHVQMADPADIDGQLMQWIAWSHEDMTTRKRR